MERKLKNGGFAVEIETLPTLWCDRKRHLGLPISFTKYILNEEKLLINTGFFNLKEEEILLYRIRDITVEQSLFDRMFGVGTLFLTSSDSTHPQLKLENVKNVRRVKQVISSCIEADRRNRNIRATELMDGGMPFDQVENMDMLGENDELQNTDGNIE